MEAVAAPVAMSSPTIAANPGITGIVASPTPAQAAQPPMHVEAPAPAELPANPAMLSLADLARAEQAALEAINARASASEQTPEVDPNRPEWLSQEFATVEDQAKAYLEAKAKTIDTPDVYDAQAIKESRFGQDEGFVEELSQKAKELGLSQDGFNKLSAYLLEKSEALIPRFDQEFTKLSAQDQKAFRQTTQWLQNSVSPEAFAQISRLPFNADMMHAFNELRRSIPLSEVKLNNVTQQRHLSQQERILSMSNEEFHKYKHDSDYRKKFMGELEMFPG